MCTLVVLKTFNKMACVSFQIWNDPQLRWNPADYGDITELRIPVTDIWTPDVVMYNT